MGKVHVQYYTSSDDIILMKSIPIVPVMRKLGTLVSTLGLRKKNGVYPVLLCSVLRVVLPLPLCGAYLA